MSFWRKGFSDDEIQFVLDEVKKFRNISPDGKVALSSVGDSDSWTAFLVSALDLEARTDALRSRIVRGILFSPDLKENFSEPDFRRVAHQLLHRYQNEETKIYRVAFPVWNKPLFLRGLKQIGDVRINLSPSSGTPIFKRVVQERAQQQSLKEFEFFFSKERLRDLKQCSLCITRVRAFSPADANERSSESICEILGIVNLAKNREKLWRSSSRIKGKLPVSDVLIGPHTTVHFENGRLAHTGFWHENWVGGPNLSHPNNDRMRVWEKHYNQLTRGVAQSAWRSSCKIAAVRYFKAFSNPNLEESFLEGWRLFENVTGTQDEKIRKRIDRVSNVFEDNIEHRIIGNHLKIRRNSITHGQPINADDEEVLAFQMLRFLVPYLERFILNPFSLKSQSDFWEFLDVSKSKEERNQEREDLNRRLSLLDNADKFHG